ncbi:MAG: nitrogen regulation protein NR(II) [Candidatus Aminicenantales bacterium]
MFKEEITKEFLNSILESMEGGVFTVDKDSRITTFNRAAEKITGYKKDEVLHRKCSEVFKSNICKNQCRLKRTLKTGQPFFRYEATLTTKTGETVYVVSTTSALKSSNNEIIGGLEIFMDITDLKSLQEELLKSEKLASLGKLAASVAHEVNNPLAGILVYIKLLLKKYREKKLQTEETEKQLLKMEKEAERTSRIIKNLLDFARQSEPTMKPVNINQVIEAALLLVGHQISLENIKLEKQLDPHLPLVCADFDQIQQVLINIILNATQAMPCGGKLAITTSAAEDIILNDSPKRTVKIDVADTGIGIPEENLDKVFTPFFTTKEKGKGVGLGLSVVHGIVGKHKGKIEVHSKPGMGTTFTVYLEVMDEKKDKNTRCR